MKTVERCYQHLLGERLKMAARIEEGMKGNAQNMPGWPYPYTRERNLLAKGKR